MTGVELAYKEYEYGTCVEEMVLKIGDSSIISKAWDTSMLEDNDIRLRLRRMRSIINIENRLMKIQAIIKIITWWGFILCRKNRDLMRR